MVHNISNPNKSATYVTVKVVEIRPRHHVASVRMKKSKKSSSNVERKGLCFISCRKLKKSLIQNLEKCDYTCTSLFELKNHYLRHQRQALTCPHCPKFVAYHLQSLRRHQRQVHSDVDQIIKCNFQSKFFVLPTWKL